MPRAIKVAVVGTGLAGLTAAHLLTKECTGNDVEFEVHLFEKVSVNDIVQASWNDPRARLPVSEWTLPLSLSRRLPLQRTGGLTCLCGHFKEVRATNAFRWFGLMSSLGYYRNLIALYRSLGVKFREADFSYSFSSLSFPASKLATRRITATMIYNGASGRAGVGKPSNFRDAFSKNYNDQIFAFATESWSSIIFLYVTIQIIICFLFTLYHSLPFWRPKNLPNITLRQWALQVTPTGYISRLIRMDTAWKDYVQTILIPLVSAVCTAPEDDVLNHPVEELLGKCTLRLFLSNLMD